MRETPSLSPRNRNHAGIFRIPRGLSSRRLAYIAVPSALVVGLATIPVVSAQNNKAPSDQQQALAGLSSGSSGSSSGLVGNATAPSYPGERRPVDTTYPDIANLPEGVKVNRVEWLSSRHISVFINSSVMEPKEVQVDILLARDWHSHPEKTYPELWALDGLRARDDANGWSIETNIAQQYADKNVNVILPVGGESSFYSDWLEPDKGKHYMWETFFTKELIPILDNGFRSNKQRAVVGLSMGGTAAINLASRNPHLFNFVGSFSGYLDTTSPGMPMAIAAALRDAGGYDAAKMWGQVTPPAQAWFEHDPKYNVGNLKDMTVYVSSGSGRDDFGVPESVAKGPANLAGVGLEVLSRMSTQTFVNTAKKENVEVVTRFRPSGVHSWEYWQFELNEAFPFIADALNLPEEDRASDCTPVGAIAEATKSGVIGSCVNNEYDVLGGKAQDFRNGTAYWSPATGAQALFGAINATYSSLDGPAGWLGFPKTSEQATPDGRGRYVHFENGSIYWSPTTGAHAIPRDMFDYWGTQGYENSHIKYPIAEAQAINGGLVQKFENGWLTRNPDGKVHFLVHGAIASKYGEMGTANSALGYPTSNEIAIKGGAFQKFENGNIYWSPETGAHWIAYGDIFNHWGGSKYEQGPFGYPTTDLQDIAAGGLHIEFQGGTIEQINGQIREERK